LALAPDGGQARTVLDQVRRAEQFHSACLLKHLLAGFERLGTAPAGSAGRARWALMRAVARLGLAVPLLPVYARFPDHVWPNGSLEE
jgi:hypothetical protein